MAVIAASSVTSTSPANAASGSANANAPANGDVFAAMLDQLAQGLANGKAVVPADTLSASDGDAATQDAATASTATPSDASTGTSTPATDPMLAQLLAAQQAATNTPAAGTPNATSSTRNGGKPASDTDAGSTATADPMALASSDAAKPAPQQDDIRGSHQPDTHVPARGHGGPDDVQPSDQIEPLQTADADKPAATDTSDQAASPAVPSTAADTAGTEAAVAALAATNQAASGIIPNGTTTKPGKATAGVAASDSNKSEDRNTKASALADASDVTKRGFASEPAVRAAALPVPGKADDSDKPASNSAPATQLPQHNAANPATLATPAQPVADAAPAQQAVAPVHATQPAPQSDPSVSIATVNTGVSPTQTPAGATPAHLAAQIQIAQQAPDVNALAVSIAAKSQDGQRHFDIRLDPAELGRVDARLTVDDAGKAQATLSVEKPQTLELLQKDSSHLERALKDAGLDLAQNGLNFSLKGQQQQQQAQDHTPFARGQRLAARAVAAIAEPAPILSSNGVSASDMRLDIRV